MIGYEVYQSEHMKIKMEGFAYEKKSILILQ